MKLFDKLFPLLRLSLIWIAVSANNVFGMGPGNLLPDYYDPLATSSRTPATFSFIRNLENKLVKLKGKLSKAVNGPGTENNSVGLHTGYGQLFNSQGGGYLGYAFLTGNVDGSDNIRLNSSFSHLLPELNSEVLFSYRLFSSNIGNTFASGGYTEDRVYENSFAASYTTFLDSFLREASVLYNYSILPQNDIRNTLYSPTNQDSGTPLLLNCGYGEAERHNVAADIVLGTEEVPLDFLAGFKFDLGIDYARISHDSYYDVAKEEIEEVSWLAVIENLTDLGIFKGSYKIGENSSMIYAGFLLGGMELYMKDTSYDNGDRTQIYGLSFTFDLDDLKNTFTPQRVNLFREANQKYDNINQIHHHTSLTTNSFKTSPKLHEVASTFP